MPRPLVELLYFDILITKSCRIQAPVAIILAKVACRCGNALRTGHYARLIGQRNAASMSLSHGIPKLRFEVQHSFARIVALAIPQELSQD